MGDISDAAFAELVLQISHAALAFLRQKKEAVIQQLARERNPTEINALNRVWEDYRTISRTIINNMNADIVRDWSSERMMHNAETFKINRLRDLIELFDEAGVLEGVSLDKELYNQMLKYEERLLAYDAAYPSNFNTRSIQRLFRGGGELHGGEEDLAENKYDVEERLDNEIRHWEDVVRGSNDRPRLQSEPGPSERLRERFDREAAEIRARTEQREREPEFIESRRRAREAQRNMENLRRQRQIERDQAEVKEQRELDYQREQVGDKSKRQVPPMSERREARLREIDEERVTGVANELSRLNLGEDVVARIGEDASVFAASTIKHMAENIAIQGFRQAMRIRGGAPGLTRMAAESAMRALPNAVAGAAPGPVADVVAVAAGMAPLAGHGPNPLTLASLIGLLIYDLSRDSPLRRTVKRAFDAGGDALEKLSEYYALFSTSMMSNDQRVPKGNTSISEAFRGRGFPITKNVTRQKALLKQIYDYGHINIEPEEFFELVREGILDSAIGRTRHITPADRNITSGAVLHAFASGLDGQYTNDEFGYIGSIDDEAKYDPSTYNAEMILRGIEDLIAEHASKNISALLKSIESAGPRAVKAFEDSYGKEYIASKLLENEELRTLDIARQRIIGEYPLELRQVLNPGVSSYIIDTMAKSFPEHAPLREGLRIASKIASLDVARVRRELGFSRVQPRERNYVARSMGLPEPINHPLAEPGQVELHPSQSKMGIKTTQEEYAPGKQDEYAAINLADSFPWNFVNSVFKAFTTTPQQEKLASVPSTSDIATAAEIEGRIQSYNTKLVENYEPTEPPKHINKHLLPPAGEPHPLSLPIETPIKRRGDVSVPQDQETIRREEEEEQHERSTNQPTNETSLPPSVPRKRITARTLRAESNQLRI